MENWEFLLQRKGDKSWLPLESPTVEILEGPYRLAARTALANNLIGIAIAYQPLDDARHQAIHQKISKRVSHDGLLIVMPYTSFVPGLWQIDCLSTESDLGFGTEASTPAWKKSIQFDVIAVSSESGADWQYNEPQEEEDFESASEADIPINLLGILPTEPTPLAYNSPILSIAEQRSTAIVQSMFEEFALFAEEEDFDQPDSTELLGDRPNLLESIEANNFEISTQSPSTDSEFQPRTLLRLKQPQYIVNQDNSFDLTGEIYTQGEIEVSLKNPQNMELVFNKRFEMTKSQDRNPINGAIPFNYSIIVPPPSQIQVLIGEVQVHPQKDFQQYNDLFITQQAIAVSYPAARVLPELIQEAQKYSTEPRDESFPQYSESFPQVSEPTPNILPKSSSTPSLSLPPLPSKNPQTVSNQRSRLQTPKQSLSLPSLYPPQNFDLISSESGLNPSISDQNQPSFPQADIDTPSRRDAKPSQPLSPEKEPELLYSFEEELPNNYQDLLNQPNLEALQIDRNFNNHGSSDRFLSKLQTLSAEAIANQKANQRTDQLFLNTPIVEAKDIDESAAIDLGDLNQPVRTISEANSLAALDHELDFQIERLESAPIINEYVWEEDLERNNINDPFTNISSSSLSETAATIRHLQESSQQPLSEQEAIPIPEIIIPVKEVISGTPIMITVRLPAITAKFFVKFWIKDLQTRTIVDGPRWLLDFTAVANADYIETRTNISIPLSSIDVAFEAIAIEAQTQRESHKIRVIRAVIPPNLAQDIF
jgi:hypothetical protein